MLSSLPPQNADDRPWYDNIIAGIVQAFDDRGFFPLEIHQDTGRNRYYQFFRDRGVWAYVAFTQPPEGRAPDDTDDTPVVVRIHVTVGERGKEEDLFIELIYSRESDASGSYTFVVDPRLLEYRALTGKLKPLYLAFASAQRKRITTREAESILGLMIDFVEATSKEGNA